MIAFAIAFDEQLVANQTNGKQISKWFNAYSTIVTKIISIQGISPKEQTSLELLSWLVYWLALSWTRRLKFPSFSKHIFNR